MMENVTVAILAGGQGRRLGGMDKGLLKVRGRRLLHDLPENLPRLIVANRNLATYRKLGVPVVCDPWPVGVNRHFWKLAQKPGKPLWFGSRGKAQGSTALIDLPAILEQSSLG